MPTSLCFPPMKLVCHEGNPLGKIELKLGHVVHTFSILMSENYLVQLVQRNIKLPIYRVLVGKNNYPVTTDLSTFASGYTAT